MTTLRWPALFTGTSWPELSPCTASMAASHLQSTRSVVVKDPGHRLYVSDHQPTPMAPDLPLRLPITERPAYCRQGAANKVGEILAAHGERDLDSFRDLYAEPLDKLEDGTCQTMLDGLARKISHPVFHLPQARLEIADHVKCDLRVTVNDGSQHGCRPLEFLAFRNGDSIHGIEPVEEGWATKNLARSDILDDDARTSRSGLHELGDPGDKDMDSAGGLSGREKQGVCCEEPSLCLLQQVFRDALLEAAEQPYGQRLIGHCDPLE
nr:hypothetical protein [Microvirga sp. KLBC 81]